MKQLRSLPTSICCCVLLSGLAAAETCDRRFPGSCRVEVSTTIVSVKGEAVQQASSARQLKQTRHARIQRSVKRPRHVARARVATAVLRHRSLAAVSRVPLPKPSPRVVALGTPGDATGAQELTGGLRPKPGLLVDDAFNVLTTGDAGDLALEQALIAKRDQMLGYASPGSDW
jgi:hypothetical protein